MRRTRRAEATVGTLEKRLASYGAMSLAVASGFAAMPAEANTIIYWNTSSSLDNTTDATQPVYFNPVTGSLSNTNYDFELFPSFNPNAGFNPGNPSCSSPGNHMPGCMSSQVTLLGTGINRVEDNGGFAADMAGAIPGPYGYGFGQQGLITDSTGTAFGSYLPAYGYVGLRLGNGDYGWAQLEILGADNVKLLGFAYDEVAGQSLNAAQTSNNNNLGGGGGSAPEPGTLIMLALGATGIAALRRRR